MVFTAYRGESHISHTYNWKIQIITRCLSTQRKYAGLGTNPSSRQGCKAYNNTVNEQIVKGPYPNFIVPKTPRLKHALISELLITERLKTT